MSRVRVLVTFVGGTGHAEPMVPVATALRDAGHTVAFAGHADPVRRLDFEQVVTTGAPTAPERRPLVEPSQEHEEEVVRRHFAGSAARSRAERYREVFADWRPDLVLRDEMDFGAAIATEALDVHPTTVTGADAADAVAAVLADPSAQAAAARLAAEYATLPDRAGAVAPLESLATRRYG